jgi:hypothetical protein
MRNMSCAITTQQVIDEIKTETRRNGWWFLRADDLICLVKKGMGLKKGEKVERLKTVVVLSTFQQQLKLISPEEVRREGFPGKSPEWFIEMFCKSHKGCTPETVVNVIKWKYVKDII